MNPQGRPLHGWTPDDVLCHLLSPRHAWLDVELEALDGEPEITPELIGRLLVVTLGDELALPNLAYRLDVLAVRLLRDLREIDHAVYADDLPALEPEVADVVKGRLRRLADAVHAFGEITAADLVRLGIEFAETEACFCEDEAHGASGDLYDVLINRALAARERAGRLRAIEA